MIYFSIFPSKLVHTLLYYIEPLYILEFLKLFPYLIDDDEFWKNKVKHNYPDVFIVNLPLHYYKKLYMRLANYHHCDVEYAIEFPDFPVDIDLRMINHFTKDREKLMELSKEVNSIYDLYSEAKCRFQKMRDIYYEKVKPIIVSVRDTHDQLQKLLHKTTDDIVTIDSKHEICYTFYMVTIDEEFLKSLNHIDFYSVQPELLRIKKFVDLVNDKYGSQGLIKCYKSGLMVNEIIPAHGTSVGIKWDSNSEVPDAIYWIDLDQILLRKTIRLALPVFVSRMLDDDFTIDDCSRLYSVPFQFVGKSVSSSSSSCSSSSSSSSSDSESSSYCEDFFLRKHRAY
jgi:hypothetical protein